MVRADRKLIKSKVFQRIIKIIGQKKPCFTSRDFPLNLVFTSINSIVNIFGFCIKRKKNLIIVSQKEQLFKNVRISMKFVCFIISKFVIYSLRVFPAQEWHAKSCNVPSTYRKYWVQWRIFLFCLKIWAETNIFCFSFR